MNKAIGFDMYNQEVTWDVSRTLKCPVGGDDKVVVFVLVQESKSKKKEVT